MNYFSSRVLSGWALNSEVKLIVDKSKEMHLSGKQFWVDIPSDEQVLLFGKNIIKSPNSIVFRKENYSEGITRKEIAIETNLSTCVLLWLCVIIIPCSPKMQ